MISFEDFKKLDLRVARIEEADRIDGSDKLIKLKIDTGESERQLVAGVGRKYGPEELVGRLIIIVANLEPRMIMGLESQGMLLAADSEEGPILLMPDREVPPGAVIR